LTTKPEDWQQENKLNKKITLGFWRFKKTLEAVTTLKIEKNT
jgi:hypothetical protein